MEQLFSASSVVVASQARAALTVLSVLMSHHVTPCHAMEYMQDSEIGLQGVAGTRRRRRRAHTHAHLRIPFPFCCSCCRRLSHRWQRCCYLYGMASFDGASTLSARKAMILPLPPTATITTTATGSDAAAAAFATDTSIRHHQRVDVPPCLTSSSSQPLPLPL